MARFFSVLADALRTALGPRRAHDVTISPERAGDIPHLTFWAERSCALRLHLPADMLVMEGAFAYQKDSHHFLSALDEGAASLAAFLAAFQPKGIAAMYAASGGKRGADLPIWDLPWILTVRSMAPRGEGGLGPEHGTAFYGPVTPQKVALEMQRLTATRDSIVKHGYRPDQHGDITGYFLRSGDRFRFLVRGGKHRAAVLVHLKHQFIPVQMKAAWPRLIDRRDAAEWPLVHQGLMDQSLAVEIFDRHFGLSLEQRFAGLH